jgi:hypothetical protein
MVKKCITRTILIENTQITIHLILCSFAPKENINKTTRLHKQETNCKASLPQGKCEDLSWQYPKVNENKEDGCSIEVEVPRCERAWYENYKAIF